MRFRTFSKAYGMAGARIGYAVGATELITSFNKIRNHFGVNRIAQAGALAALADQSHLQSVIDQTAQARIRIEEIGRANGLAPIPSATNFVTLDCGRDGDHARAVLGKLLEAGLFVRMPFVSPQDRAIRLSCGTVADLDLVEATLPKVLAKLG